jgi:glycerophosphoryl diester phosphodiesterase
MKKLNVLLSNSFLNILLLLIFISVEISCSTSNIASLKAEEQQISEKSIIEKIKERSKSEILVCAHRAYHKNAPENSIESIKQAIEANIDIVEIDISMTKDSVLVLMHDDKIDRTTTGSGYVKDFTYKELKGFNLKIGDSITLHQIPTLDEVLALSKGEIILNLDLKHIANSQFYQLLKSHNMQNQVFSFIWDKEKISEILAIDSNYAVLPEVSNRTEMMYYSENIKSKLQHLNEQSFNKENLDWAKNNGILVFMNILWEPDTQFIQNNTKKVDDIVALNPAIIQTDHPKKVLEYLKSKNLHK